MDILDVEINQKNYIKILSICLLFVFLIIGIYYAVLLIPKGYTLEKETKVAAFEDEKDLEEEVNNFLFFFTINVIDIKYQVAVSIFSEEQVFCFSAMIIYS